MVTPGTAVVCVGDYNTCIVDYNTCIVDYNTCITLYTNTWRSVLYISTQLTSIHQYCPVHHVLYKAVWPIPMHETYGLSYFPRSQHHVTICARGNHDITYVLRIRPQILAFYRIYIYISLYKRCHYTP